MADDDPIFSPVQRFGCGAILAGTAALLIIVRFVGPGWPAFAVILVVAIAGGLFAIIGGDRAPFRLLEHFFQMLWGMFPP